MLILRAKAISHATHLQAWTVCKHTLSLSDTQHSLDDGSGSGTHKVVYDVGESPHHRHAEEGDAEQHDVKDADAERVGQPDPPAVHDPSVGVHLTVCHTHVHSGLRAENRHTHMLV